MGWPTVAIVHRSATRTVQADDRWAGMYRVLLSDGHLTDMVNLARAKDAAISLAITELNKKAARAA